MQVKLPLSRLVKYLLIAVLLVGLGVFSQYRLGLVERTPWLARLAGPNQTRRISSNTISSSSLSRILNGETPTDMDEVDMSVFWQTWKLLEDEYYLTDKLDPKKMVDGAVAGMVAALGDPYTAYLPPKENELSGQRLAGAFFGVGIELGYSEEGILSVVSPLKGTPADEAGLQPGDLILNVKDEQKGIDEGTNQWSLDHAVETIRGPKGTTVTLTLLREGGEAPFEVGLVRDEIVIHSVELAYPEIDGKKVAHITLSSFGERTEEEWNIAVEDILRNRSSISGIVLDMRNNPGGLFDSAIYIASEFVRSGTIVSQKGKTNSTDYVSKGRHRLVDIPTVVMINDGSASASEIVAGALKDQKNSKLIGTKSFGKGTVQDRIELSNQGGVHITIAQWLTPKGTWIHEEGINVDIESEDDPETADIDEALVMAAAQL